MDLELFFSGIDVFGSAVITAILANVFLISLIGGDAVTDILEHFAKADKLIANDFIIFIQGSR